jgi:RNA polymerase sigma-70 factor (ECF subfamily)
MAHAAVSDGECWARALAGDRSGIAELYDRHATAIYNHCYQRLASRTEAEDVTAEVFIVALRTGEQVDPHPEAGLRPWLLGVANNLLRRHSRARAVLGRAYRRLRLERDELPDIAERIADQSADAYYLTELIDVLSALSVADQELIQLCVLQGISPAVVADITGRAPATVRSRLSRALARARRELHRREKLPSEPGDRSGPDAALTVTTTHPFLDGES